MFIQNTLDHGWCSVNLLFWLAPVYIPGGLVHMDRETISHLFTSSPHLQEFIFKPNLKK